MCSRDHQFLFFPPNSLDLFLDFTVASKLNEIERGMNRTDQKLKGGNGLRDRWKMGSNECKQRKFYSRRDGVGLYICSSFNGMSKTERDWKWQDKAPNTGCLWFEWMRFKLGNITALIMETITFMWSVSGMCLWYSCCTGCVRWWHWVTKGSSGPGLVYLKHIHKI